MSNTDEYNGWTNRETWAVALHINNDQGWQESVLEALREDVESHRRDGDGYTQTKYDAGEIVRENVEETLSAFLTPETQHAILSDIGSFWRVNWTELGAAFLSDLAEDDA